MHKETKKQKEKTGAYVIVFFFVATTPISFFYETIPISSSCTCWPFSKPEDEPMLDKFKVLLLVCLFNVSYAL